jgi:hypothetical protein
MNIGVTHHISDGIHRCTHISGPSPERVTEIVEVKVFDLSFLQSSFESCLNINNPAANFYRTRKQVLTGRSFPPT